MPKVKEVMVFEFDELSDEAKEKAREWFRAGDSFDFESDFIVDDAADIGEMMGLDIRTKRVKLMNGSTRLAPSILFSGFSSQGDGACFEGSWSAKAVKPGAVKDHAPNDKTLHEIAAELERIALAHPDSSMSICHRGHYSHSGCMVFSFDAGDCGDDGEEECALSDDTEESMRQCARDFADWIYSQLEKEYDYKMSNENVDETIRLNEYTFLEDGTRD